MTDFTEMELGMDKEEKWEIRRFYGFFSQSSTKFCLLFIVPLTVVLPSTNKMVVSAARGQLGCCGMTRHALGGPERLLVGKGMLFLRASPTPLREISSLL